MSAWFSILNSPCLPKCFLSLPKYGPFTCFRWLNEIWRLKTCTLLFVFCLWCHTSIVGFFAVFRCVWDISPRFASQFISEILYRRILATANFRQWFRLLSEISRIFHRYFAWNGKISRHLAEKSFSGDVKYRRYFARAKQVFRLHYFCTVRYTPHPCPPAPSLAMAGSQFLTHAKTVLLQDYQIQLQLRPVEPHCGLGENVISLVNSMDVLEKDLLRKLFSVKNFEPTKRLL